MLSGVLLAAGLGTRLRPLTEATPKAALPLLDIPLGAYGLALLAPLGETAFNVSHLAAEAEAALAPWAPAARVLREPEPFGTAGTLRALAADLAPTFVTLNADALTDVEPLQLLAAHEAGGATATLVVQDVATGADLRQTPGGVEFIDRRQRTEEPGLRFTGLAAFSRAVLDLIPHRGPRGIAESILLPLASRRELHLFHHTGYFLDVGTPERYLQANLDALHETAPRSPAPPPGAVREVTGGTAYIGPDADVKEATIGANAIVMRGARVEGRVEQAAVMPYSHVPPDTHVKDTIWSP